MSGRHTDMSKHIGNTYNYLQVISIDTDTYVYKEKNIKRTYFNCLCICSEIKKILAGNVLSGTIKSCGCKKSEITKKAISGYYDKKYEYPVEGKSYSSYKKHGKEFNISFLDFVKLTNSNCYYCNVPPNNLLGNKTLSKVKYLNGVDRIDSSIGYNIDNCVPCCKQCNVMKNVYSEKEFLIKIKEIYEFKKLE